MLDVFKNYQCFIFFIKKKTIIINILHYFKYLNKYFRDKLLICQFKRANKNLNPIFILL